MSERKRRSAGTRLAPAAWATPTRRQLAMLALLVAAALAVLYYVLPKLAGLDETWERISQGDPLWLGAAVAFELLSFASYVMLFRRVFAEPGSPLGWRESYQVTMAGLAATRLFATAGAGGIALTAWALRRMGMAGDLVAARMTTFIVLLYGVYMLALVFFGIGLRTGVLHGGGSPAITLLPAVLGAVVIVAVLALALPGPRRSTGPRPGGRFRLGPFMVRLAAAGGTGVRGALRLVRHADPAIPAAVGWWAFDIAVLWACFHAFGEPPPMPVVVMAYFVGMAANTLPVPGGVGSVEGGMIGALIAFGVTGGLAIVAVLSYRALAFWLPTIPGALAYVGLRRTIRRWQSNAGPA